MSAVVHLDGAWVPAAEARVSVLDRGFLFGDGVYEVIPVYAGALFRLDEHLARLRRSLAEARLDDPHDAAGWADLLQALVARNGGGDLAVYLQVTRGVAPRDHVFPAQATPTVFAMANPLRLPTPEQRAQGLAGVVRPDPRWLRCDIKAIALLANVLLRQEAADSGAAEAILVREGIVTEGAASNVFLVREGTILTPPKGPHILPGVTRDLILELAQAAGLPWREEPLPEAALRDADELWVSSSTKEVMPVVSLDGVAVGTGAPGPVWARMHALFQEYKRGPAQAASA
jgi:D-alanine transaminase